MFFFFFYLHEIDCILIIMFQVGSMTLDDFAQVKKGLDAADQDFEFSKLEKKLLEKLARVEVTGKRSRPVPVLLDEEVLTSLQLLVSTRTQAGVAPDNNFVFGVNNKVTFFGTVGATTY